MNVNNSDISGRAIKTKWDGLWDGLDLAFKILFLLMGFLQNSSLTFGKPVISWVLWPTIALGGVLMLYRVVHFKRFLCTRGLIFLVLFLVSFAVSALMFRQYNLYENFRAFVYLVFQFGLLFAFDKLRDPSHYARQLKVLTALYIVGVAILSAISFILMICGVSKTILPDDKQLPIYYIGFVWGRLFGAYWDPNIGSVLAVLALLLSMLCFMKTTRKWVQVLLVFNMALQLLYAAFSDSRTGRLCLAAGAVTMAFLLSLNGYWKIVRRAVWLNVTVCVVIVALASVLLPVGIKRGYNALVSTLSFGQTDPDHPSGKLPEVNLGRSEDYANDVTNRRGEIWGSAMEIFKKSPLIGVSRNGIVGYAQDNLPKTYIVNNDHQVFNSMHNLFFDILVSQGVFGTISFWGFALFSVIVLFRRFNRWKDTQNPVLYLYGIGVLATVVISTMVMTEIVYVVSPISTIFWVYLGYLFRAYPVEKKAEPAGEKLPA